MDFSKAPEDKGLNPRMGSDQDASNLDETFSRFGYLIDIRNNLRAQVSIEFHEKSYSSWVMKMVFL